MEGKRKSGNRNAGTGAGKTDEVIIWHVVQKRIGTAGLERITGAKGAAHVYSGMMTLKQAVWIIMGANIGTTITGQLVALD